MYNSAYTIHTTQGEKRLAKIYLYCLPFRMFALFSFLQLAVGPLAGFFDSIINIIGLMVWYHNEGSLRFHSRNYPLLRTIAYSIIYLNVSSIIMSLVMYANYGECNGKSPFVAIVPMILFYTQYILIFLYNIRVFDILDYTTIKKVLNVMCKALLIIGYVQILAMHGIGTGIYDFFAKVIGGLRLSDQLPKLCLTLNEGAAAGCLMGTLVFPYLFARYNNGDKKVVREIMLWMPLLFFTHSSTAFILFAVDFVIFLTRNKKRSLGGIFGLSALAVTIVGAIFFISAKTAMDERDTVQYLLFEKAFDENNGSTISRTATFRYNWGAFTEMPIMGVGNGLQGYFYNKYFPKEYLYLDGTDIGKFYEIAQTGIANGECFLPGYFSGYGLIGLIVLLIIISSMWKTYKSRMNNLGLFGDMYAMGAFGFIAMGIQGEAYCLYYAWFVISIPFMYFSREEIIKG